MKKLFLFLLVAVLMASCAAPRQVGHTKEAARSHRNNANRVGTQFIGIR